MEKYMTNGAGECGYKKRGSGLGALEETAEHTLRHEDSSIMSPRIDQERQLKCEG